MKNEKKKLNWLTMLICSKNNNNEKMGLDLLPLFMVRPKLVGGNA